LLTEMVARVFSVGSDIVLYPFLVSRLLKRPPAAFSRRSEAQRTAQSTIRLFACCGLADGLLNSLRAIFLWLETLCLQHYSHRIPCGFHTLFSETGRVPELPLPQDPD